jgi:Transposase protein
MFILKNLNKLEQTQKGLARIFPSDQVKMIMRNEDFKRSNKRWSDDAITDALLKKSCWGKKGYEISIESNMPYPSNKTVLKRIEHIKFEPGLQHILIEGLGKKLGNMKDSNLAQWALMSFDEITHK